MLDLESDPLLLTRRSGIRSKVIKNGSAVDEADAIAACPRVVSHSADGNAGNAGNVTFLV